MSTWRPFGSGAGSEEPRRVGDSLGGVARSLGGPAPGVLSVVFSHWEDAVGPAVADHATPLSLRGPVLVVAVPDPAWATQLRFLEAEILERLAEAAGGAVAERIEVRVRPPAGGGAGRSQGRRRDPRQDRR